MEKIFKGKIGKLYRDKAQKLLALVYGPFANQDAEQQCTIKKKKHKKTAQRKSTKTAEPQKVNHLIAKVFAD